MGCMPSIYKKKVETRIECMKKLDDLSGLLDQMIRKYETQEKKLDTDLKTFIRQGKEKRILIQTLKRKKVIQHYIQGYQTKIDAVYVKRYAVEQLSITQLQVETMRSTANVFKGFAANNSVEKIENLNDSMVELTDQVFEIDNLLAEPLVDFDDDALEKELENICLIPVFPEAPVSTLTTVRTNDLDDVSEQIIETLPLLMRPVEV